jgi:hypothetical protein
VKLGSEERIVAAPLHEAELDDFNERGAGAWIEFMREGHAKVTITISRELIEQATPLDFDDSGTLREGDLVAVLDASELARPLPQLCIDGPIVSGQSKLRLFRAAGAFDQI